MFVDTSFCIDLLREQHRNTEGPATAKLRELADTPLLTRDSGHYALIPGLVVETY